MITQRDVFASFPQSAMLSSCLSEDCDELPEEVQWKCHPARLDDLPLSKIFTGSSATGDLPSLSECTLATYLDIGEHTFLGWTLETENGVIEYFNFLTCLAYQLDKDVSLELVGTWKKAVEYLKTLCGYLIHNNDVTLVIILKQELWSLLSLCGSLHSMCDEDTNSTFIVQSNYHLHALLFLWASSWNVFTMINDCPSTSASASSDFELVSRLFISGLVSVFHKEADSFGCACFLKSTLSIYHITPTVFCSTVHQLVRETPITERITSTEHFGKTVHEPIILFSFLVSLTKDLVEVKRIEVDTRDYAQSLGVIVELACSASFLFLLKAWNCDWKSVCQSFYQLIKQNGTRGFEGNLTKKFKDFVGKVVDAMLSSHVEFEVNESDWINLPAFFNSSDSLHSVLFKLASLLFTSSSVYQFMVNKLIINLGGNVFASSTDAETRTVCTTVLVIADASSDCSDLVKASIDWINTALVKGISQERITTLLSFVKSLRIIGSGSDVGSIQTIRTNLLKSLIPRDNEKLLVSELSEMIRSPTSLSTDETVLITSLSTTTASLLYSTVATHEQHEPFPEDVWSHCVRIAKETKEKEVYRVVGRQVRIEMNSTPEYPGPRLRRVLEMIESGDKTGHVQADGMMVSLLLSHIMEPPHSHSIHSIIDRLIPLWIYSIIADPLNFSMFGEMRRVSELMWEELCTSGVMEIGDSSRNFEDLDKYVIALFQHISLLDEGTAKMRLEKWIPSYLISFLLKQMQPNKEKKEHNVGRVCLLCASLLEYLSQLLEQIADEKTARGLPKGETGFVRLLSGIEKSIKCAMSDEVRNSVMSSLFTAFRTMKSSPFTRSRFKNILLFCSPLPSISHTIRVQSQDPFIIPLLSEIRKSCRPDELAILNSHTISID